MPNRLTLADIISRVFDNVFTGILVHCSAEMSLCANLIYRHFDQSNYYPGQIIENTPEEVDAIIEGINRVNARWPGALRPVHPPKPKPVDLSQILWIMDSMVFWPHNRNHPPSDKDIIAVATGEAPTSR